MIHFVVVDSTVYERLIYKYYEDLDAKARGISNIKTMYKAYIKVFN